MTIRQSIFIVFFVFCLQFFNSAQHIKLVLKSDGIAQKTQKIHFRDVCKSGDGFIAVGSDGCLYAITKSGETEKLTCDSEASFSSVLMVDKQIIAGGDNGALIRYDAQKNLHQLNSKTEHHIKALIWFRDKLIAGTDNGEIITGDLSGLATTVELNLKGDIVSFSCSNSRCFGVTNEGEIINTINGESWEIFDFNAYYKGFYQPCSFTGIEFTGNKIAVIGVHPDGSPGFYSSNRGSVWTEKALVYNDNNEGVNYLNEKPNDILYDEKQDRYILLCDGGGLMTIPSCSQCNKYFKISVESLFGGAINESTLLVIGSQGFIQVIALGLL